MFFDNLKVICNMFEWKVIIWFDQESFVMIEMYFNLFNNLNGLKGVYCELE